MRLAKPNASCFASLLKEDGYTVQKSNKNLGIS